MEQYPTFRARGEVRTFTDTQLSLFDRSDVVKPAMHVSMGYYYELVTAAMFGGRCQNNIYRRDDETLTKPDVVTDTNMIFESKANRTGHQLLLLDDQVERYKYPQHQRPWPKIYFAIYRHQVKGIKSFKGTSTDLWKALSNTTTSGIVIPFSVVSHLHRVSSDDELKHLVLYYTSWAYQCARVRSPTVNAFLNDPYVVLSALRLNPEDYRWKIWMSPKLEINGIKIKQFPFVLMEDKDHRGWAQKFSGEVPLNEVPF